MIFFSITVLFTKEESLTKKTYNIPFAGGKEKISYLDDKDIGTISILSKEIYIDLYENYSKIRVVYILKNQKNSSINIMFLYPKIDIDKKNIEINNNIESKNDEYVRGNYSEFTAKVDDKLIQPPIKDYGLIEPDIPIKTERTTIKSSTDKPDYIYMESVDSFTYLYGFYSIPIAFLEKDKIKIELSYTSKHYYNEIISTNFSNREKYEEPSLKYCYYKNEDDENDIVKAESDKLFFYTLWTNQYFNNGNKEDTPINDLHIELRSHIVNNDYLNVSPKNYSQKNNLFIWKYKNFIPKSINNIMVTISSENENKFYPKSLFKITPDIIKNPYENLYKLILNKDISIEYKENKEIEISEIIFSPKIYNNKYDVRAANNPLIFEITFFNKNNMNNPILIVKKEIKPKFYFHTIKKRTYITIFKGSPVKSNLIKIRILKGSIPNDDTFYIGNIQIK